jgi:hypothetical protein
MCSGLRTRGARCVGASFKVKGMSETGKTRSIDFGDAWTFATITRVVSCIVKEVGGILITLLRYLNNARLFEYSV